MNNSQFLLALLSLVASVASWRIAKSALRGDWKRFRVEQEQLQIRLIAGCESMVYRSGEVTRTVDILVENRSSVEVRVQSISAFLRIRAFKLNFGWLPGEVRIYPNLVEGWHHTKYDNYLLDIAGSISIVVRENFGHGGAIVSFPLTLPSGKLSELNVSLTTPPRLESPADMDISSVLIGARMRLHDDTLISVEARGWSSKVAEADAVGPT